MATLVPWSLLRVCPDTELFGSIDYEGDSVTWPLLASLGVSGNTVQGFCTDPSGDYLMQSPVTIWQDSGTTAWTATSGTYTQGTDTAVKKADNTPPKTLKQSVSTGAFDTKFTAALAADEGCVLKLWIGAVPSGSTGSFYVDFNTTLRLAFEPGQPIRLQTPDTRAAGGWGDLAVSTQGDCDTYLGRVGGWITIDVLAETDPSWTSGRASSAPPSQICVTLNGQDDCLTIPASTLPGGQVRVHGSNRQWGALVGRKRFAITGLNNVGALIRPVPLEGTPDVTLQGYFPANNGVTYSVTRGSSPNQVSASLALSVPAAGKDSTGYAIRSVYLTALTAEYPVLETEPLGEPNWSEYLPIHTRVLFTWDQGTSLARASGEVTFLDVDGLLAPGSNGVLPATRAFQLFLGNLPMGVTPTPDNLTLVMTGYTGLRENEGFRWRKQGGQTAVTISLDDRLIKANKACLYNPPRDGTCHYWAMEQAAHRCGFLDADLNFPLCSKYQTGEYWLSYGTAQNPKFQPRPEDILLGHMLEIRADSGDVDFSGQIQPMVLGTDAAGGLDYFALAIGVVQAFLNPGEDPAVHGLVPVQAFSAFPLFDSAGNPYLNEFLEFLETVAALDQIRSEAVFEGLDVNSGGAIAAYALNPQLTTDPTQAGYIGAVRNAYVQISRRISSLPVAQRQAALAQVLLAFPAIRAFPVGHLNPEIFILDVISVTDFATQGTNAPVGYYATSVMHEVGLDPSGKRYGLTHVGGRALGQAD